MKVIITGGGGFLGSRLCAKLLERDELSEPIEEIVLLDARFSGEQEWDERVRLVEGDISERDLVLNVISGKERCSVFHLASMVSGECEERFDDALRVNLDGGRNVFEAARALEGRSRVIFASSIACFGGEEVATSTMSDRSKHYPQTTYGMSKAMCELMVNDYTRKGYFDGRSARLPTVIIRPGEPNAAASSWASGMFREPLHGKTCELPVRRDQPHPMTGYRTVIESLIALHEVPEENLGCDRAYGLPAHRVTPEDAERVVREVGEERGIAVGDIIDACDVRIQGIVEGWASEVDGGRAVALGLPRPPDLKTIIGEYCDDYLAA